MPTGSGTEDLHVSIRTPREGRDRWAQLLCARLQKFQSARPARGATYHWSRFNPHAPRGARRCQTSVSIRTPREGRDNLRLQLIG